MLDTQTRKIWQQINKSCDRIELLLSGVYNRNCVT